jgi:hypothetical protein
MLRVGSKMVRESSKMMRDISKMVRVGSKMVGGVTKKVLVGTKEVDLSISTGGLKTKEVDLSSKKVGLSDNKVPSRQKGKCYCVLPPSLSFRIAKCRVGKFELEPRLTTVAAHAGFHSAPLSTWRASTHSIFKPSNLAPGRPCLGGQCRGGYRNTPCILKPLM